MTEALCGPSNALSSLQKHTQVDRTLQQDRLRGTNHSPAQGFRSFDPRAGSLDADFAAFENAPTNPFQLQQPQWQQSNPGFAPAQSTSSWASDFQNLRIANTPLPVSQFRQAAPLIKTAPGGWQQEFTRQNQNMSLIAQQKQPETAPYNMLHTNAPFLGGAAYAPQPSLLNQQMPAGQVEGSRFSEADFEKAFQDVSQEMNQEMQSSDVQITEAGHDLALEEPIDDIPDTLNQVIHETPEAKIGSDAIEYTETKDRTVDQDARDANDLARVAGQLVQNVSHETNEKFRNSQFLDLMRRIRDREIEVRNNDFEPAAEAAKPFSQPATVQPENDHSFQFPNMNSVYEPDHHDPIDMSVEDDFRYTRNQISDLHPGGPFYPEQSPPPAQHAQLPAQMSGAVDASSTDDASGRYAQA